MVGRGVARVQRDHDVHRRRRDALQVALDEREAGAVRARGDAVAELDQLGAQLDAGDLRRDAEAAAQVLVDGEGEIALAAAVVDDAQRARRRGAFSRRRQRIERVVEDLEELVDLAPLARHRRNQAVARVGEAELDQPGQIERQAARALAIVRRLGRQRRRRAVGIGRADMPPQRRTTLPADEQMAVGAVRAQRRMGERRGARRVEMLGDGGDRRRRSRGSG